MPRVFYDYSGLGLTSMCKPSMASSNKTYKFPHPCEHKRTRGQARVLVWGRKEGGARAQEGAGKRRGRCHTWCFDPRKATLLGRPDRSEHSYHDDAQPRRSHHPPRPERAPAGLRLQECCQLASAPQATDHADCGAHGGDRQLEAIEGS